MPWSPRRVLVALVAVAALCAPAGAAAQDSTIPDNGAGVSTTPPVPLSGDDAQPAAAEPADLPNTGTDPRMLFLAGMAMSLLGAGLRLRTADVDDY